MLLLLGAVSIAPFLGSLLLYYFWTPSSFTNYGELIAPMPLAGVTIPASSGKPLQLDELAGNWVFLMTDSGRCDEYCRSKLYVMRQIRLTQGRDQTRIERVWLITDGTKPAPSIEEEYAGTRLIQGVPDAFVTRLPAPASARDHIYVIDPYGNLMMRFPRDADPRRMKKDVSKLMKMSGGWIRTAPDAPKQ